MAITYNTANIGKLAIYRTTGGGTVFSTNYVDTAAFDYFSDSAVVNDALYFACSGSYNAFSDITINIGTAFAATSYTIVWERYLSTTGWTQITNCIDETVMFSVTGLKTFKFGAIANWAKQTVNGSLAFWVRARISTVSGITEGGANSTYNVVFKDGRVNIDGYTDGSPCTPELVYQYLNTNYPYVGVVKTGTHYDFTNVFLWMNSRFLISLCSVETCMGGTYPGTSDFSYLQMGYKKDNYTGYSGGVFIVKSNANTYGFDFSTLTRIYGSKVLSITGSGYPALIGEWIDSDIENMNFSPNPLGIVRNCRFVSLGVWIASVGFPTTFDRNRVLLTGSWFAYFYNADVDMPNLTWSATASVNSFLFFYQMHLSPTFTFINPSPSLPSITSSPKILYRYDTAPVTNFSKVFYYNSVALTYTDYTTEFGSNTINDAPVSGEVGDCYYFQHTSSFFPLAVKIETNLGSNDYAYAFEYYNGSSWIPCLTWDTTNKFATTNIIYLAHSGVYFTLITINGVSGYWIRVRITTKGTGTKYITKAYFSTQTGVSNWNVYEKFTLDINAVDNNAVAISSASVSIKLNGNSIYSGTTDASGNMVQQPLIYRRWYFDAVNFPNNYQQIAEVTYNDYDLTISKTGYETYTAKVKMITQRILQITLKPVTRTRYTIEGKPLRALLPENGSSSKLIEI